MDLRDAKALEIAATFRLTFEKGIWLVPSQNSTSVYRVSLAPGKATCECEDFALRDEPCKHVMAARFVQARDHGGEAPVVDTNVIPKKPTYKQNWPAYNLAQSTEKRRVRVLLNELTSRLPNRDRGENKSGPKPHLVRDCIFAMAYKVYCGLSSRRFSTDLEEAYEMRFVSKVIPGAKVTAFFEDDYFTTILKDLIAISAAPLRAVETTFAIDSSGFGSCRYEKWYDQKYGVTRNKCVWVKVHIACGVKTNVVTAVRILDKDAADCPQFIPLLTETRKRFEVGEVSADKAYASLDNFEEVAKCGGSLYATFKSNTTGGVGGLFEKAFHYFQFNREEYLTHYHQRSNVESTFSAVKRKFGNDVMSKTDTAMVNESLCKLLCHNLTCLIQEQETLGIVPIFWKDEEKYESPAILSMVGAQRN